MLLFTNMYHCPHCDAFILTQEKIHSLTLSLLSLCCFFPIKVTPRVSLFRPSHYLLTNSFSNSGPMYTNSTANISNTFLITYYFFLPCYSKWKSHNVVWLSEVGVWKWGRHCRIFLFIFFPEVLISRSNEQAAVHGHQAIIFGYHANSEHDGMLLYWEIDPGSMTVVVKY